MEEGKNRRGEMKDWKTGRLGRLGGEDWKDGRLEDWGEKLPSFLLPSFQVLRFTFHVLLILVCGWVTGL